VNLPYVLASSTLALILVLALAREVRMRRTLHKLLAQILTLGETVMRRMFQLLPFLLLLSLTGCDSSDPRIARMAEQQARQNEALAQQHQQIATATRTLIEADKQAR